MGSSILLLLVGIFASSVLAGPFDVREVVLRADNGKYLSRFTRSSVHLLEAAKDVPDIFCKFTVIRNGDDTYSFIADNGNYLSRLEVQGTQTVQTATATASIASRFVVTDYEDGTISLRADNGKYLSRIHRGEDINPIEASKESADVFSRFTITEVKVAGEKFAGENFTAVNFQPVSVLAGPLGVHEIILRADNGKYLSRIARYASAGRYDQFIEAHKDVPDIYCKFTVIRIGDDTYSFIADNGDYLSRLEVHGKQTIQILAAATTSIAGRFVVTNYEDGTISLRADNGKYLSRINRGQDYNPIEASKGSADVYSRFTITEVKVAGENFQPVLA